MTRILLRITYSLLSIVLLGLIPSVSQAQACSTPYTITVKLPSGIKFDASAPIGTVLWSGSTDLTSASGSCTAGVFTKYIDGTRAYLGNNLYETGVPGVAVKMGNITKVIAGVGGSCTSDIAPSSCTAAVYWNGTAINAVPLTISFVKTGPISSAGPALLSGSLMRTTNGDSRILSANFIWSSGATLQPINPTCTVATTSIAVALGNTFASQFSGVGSVTAATPFNISLQCSGGTSGYTSAIYTTLSDPVNPGNVSSTLTMAPNSTATGVGIQILNGTTPIMYGPDSNVAGNTNQWSAGTATNGTFNIPLTARYIQTAPNITPGTANGAATFTMSYQ